MAPGRHAGQRVVVAAASLQGKMVTLSLPTAAVAALVSAVVQILYAVAPDLLPEGSTVAEFLAVLGFGRYAAGTER